MAKVAVITGSNGLIGQATCRRLAQSGHLAVGIDVGAEGAGNWPHYQCDLRDLARMEATLAAIERDHGLIRVLFNNAGIYHPGKDWLDVPPDQFDDTMSVNVRVPYFASQWVAKRLIAAGAAWCDRQHRIVRRTARQHGGRVRRLQGRRHQPDQEPRHAARPARHPCERHRAGSDQHRDGRTYAADGEGAREVQRTGTLRRAGRDRRRWWISW